MHFIMLSAICFKLDQSKILSSGNGITNIKLAIVRLHSIENAILDIAVHTIKDVTLWLSCDFVQPMLFISCCWQESRGTL